MQDTTIDPTSLTIERSLRLIVYIDNGVHTYAIEYPDVFSYQRDDIFDRVFSVETRAQKSEEVGMYAKAIELAKQEGRKRGIAQISGIY